ncbi:alpha/beta hydrolase [Sulfurimonas sp. HSL3-7]|uniref:RBBP9/YdeN family alpha/beta hydrolase n=1 Tax=Sulfonitrofixus jiaomeiensis TaxID=3131938 RepID=UPI0031F74306
MREKVLLLHGWGGSDYPHWQAWLAGEIAKNYGTVAFPLLDHPHFPTKNRWMKQVKALLKEFRPDVVICHSLANTLWFHLCNEGEIETVKRLLLVAPPRLDLELDTIKSFFQVEPPKELFAKEAMLVTSDNDPYMTAAEAVELQKALGVEMKVLENAGHINAESGFGEWPWVIKWVKGEA